MQHASTQPCQPSQHSSNCHVCFRTAVRRRSSTRACAPRARLSHSSSWQQFPPGWRLQRQKSKAQPAQHCSSQPECLYPIPCAGKVTTKAGHNCPKSPQGVSAGQPSPVRSPKQPARPGAALPKGSPPASADERSPQRQLRTRSELLEADKKPQGANGKCASPTVELVIRCGLVQVLHGPCLLPCRYKAVCNISVVAR